MAKRKPTQIRQNLKLEQQLAEVEAKWKRALADYQNLEKRIARDQQQFVILASAEVILKLLPVVDHLKMAAVHLKDAGLELIVKQLNDLLISEGVTEIEALNQPFDPNRMECNETVAGPINQVVAEVESGYMMNDQVIRPAKVKVGNGEDNKNTTNNSKEDL